MNAHDTVKKTHIKIMTHKKWCRYAGILSCGDVVITDAIDTAATDGWDVMYNPYFLMQTLKTDAQRRLLVLHEATHKAYQHLFVWKTLSDEDSYLANVAMDHFVNLSLMDEDNGEGFLEMPEMGIQPEPKYRGWSVKHIFDDLKKNPPPPKGGNNGSMDSHEWDKAKARDAKEVEEQAKEIDRAIRQGEVLAKKRGSKDGNAPGSFGDLLLPRIDWRAALRDFVQEVCAGKDESSWRRPNRRYLADDVYMPSLSGVTLAELVVGFDTSGSCFGSEEMTRFVSEITTIIEQVKPSKTHVIYWDSNVRGMQTFEDGQFAVQNLKPMGGGGTDGSVLFDYLRSNNINPTAIVQFTDGYVGDWGTSSWPTLWAVTSNKRAPFGTTIKLDV